MKTLRFIFISLALALPGAAARAVPAIPWNGAEYSSEFKYLQEKGAYTPGTWAALMPEQQARALSDAAEPAAERAKEIKTYYADAMKKWDIAGMRSYVSKTKAADVKAVRLWLGKEKAEALVAKLTLTRDSMKKAAAGLTEEDALALKPHLLPQAIAELRAAGAASRALREQAGAKARTSSASGAALDKFTAAGPSALNADSFAKLYDNMNASGNAPVAADGARYAARNAAQNGIVYTAPQKKAAFTMPEVKAAPITKAAPAAVEKSTKLTSDAYGITLYTAGSAQPRTFRKGADAAAVIRGLPDGSVTKIIIYGHGSPGMQTMGPEVYDADSTSELLKGKMARGGVVQFSGCNTASIGGPTLNPAVGLSMVARRLLYFSLPYFQDRADGISAEQAKQQWEKGWNADLALDTSHKIKGAVVCGYRTFGLVPGRLPGVTRLMGNQEATTPGYVAGKKACYQDGREVPAP